MDLDTGRPSAWKLGLERLANRLVAGYAARCAVRAQARAERAAADRKEYVPDGIFAVVPDGTLAVARQDSTYFLWLEWDNAYGQRLLAQGELADIERTMTEVAVHGPTGGPEFRGQGTDWHRRRDHDTEHSLTLGGELRLMRLFGGPYLLLFARNDGGICILGIGDAEELKRTAGARLKSFVGDALNIHVGDARLQLRAVGAAGVLGYLEMFDGITMLLGHLSGEGFGLVHMRGGKAQCVGLYDLDALQRGDLGQVLRWTGVIAEDARDDDVDNEHDRVDNADSPVRQRGSRPRGAQPLRSRRISYKARLSAEDLNLINRHMTLSETPAGKGSTILSALTAPSTRLWWFRSADGGCFALATSCSSIRSFCARWPREPPRRQRTQRCRSRRGPRRLLQRALGRTDDHPGLGGNGPDLGEPTERHEHKHGRLGRSRTPGECSRVGTFRIPGSRCGPHR